MQLELDHERWKVVISDDVGDCEWGPVHLKELGLQKGMLQL